MKTGPKFLYFEQSYHRDLQKEKPQGRNTKVREGGQEGEERRGRKTVGEKRGEGVCFFFFNLWGKLFIKHASSSILILSQSRDDVSLASAGQWLSTDSSTKRLLF